MLSFGCTSIKQPVQHRWLAIQCMETRSAKTETLWGGICMNIHNCAKVNDEENRQKKWRETEKNK